MLTEIESAIALKITAPLEALGVKVRTTPDTEDSGVQVRGMLILGYTGSSFSGSTQKTYTKQTRTLDFELSIIYKDLQTHKDNYKLIEKILELLTGFVPIECDGQYGALYPTRDGFVSRQDGFWRYSITFSLISDYPNY